MNRIEEKTKNLEIRFAESNEISLVKKLLEENHETKISIEQRSKGFLVYRPSIEELISLNEELGIVVAKEAENLAGYLILMSRERAHQDEFFSKFSNEISKVKYRKKILECYNYFVFAQVCIDKRYRGLYVQNRTYDFAEKSHPRFELAVAEINDENKVSLAASKQARFKKVGSCVSESSLWHIVVRERNKT